MLNVSRHINRDAVVQRAQTQNPRQQVWLNVASSYEVLPNYINLDNSVYYRLEPFMPVLRHLVRPARVQAVEKFKRASEQAPVLLHDCRRRLPFEDGVVDHVLCSHFLEHVYPNEAAGILADFFRVLRPNGTLHVIVPSLDQMVRTYVAGVTDADTLLEQTGLSSKDRPTLTFRLLEFFGYEGLKHRWMYDADTIADLVKRAGFELGDLDQMPSKAVRSLDGDASVHVAAKKVALL